MKKISATFIGAWLGTALLLLITPAVENAGSAYESVGEGLTLASICGTLVLVVVSFISLRGEASITVKMAISMMLMPVCMAFLLWMLSTQPNIHDTSFGGLLINGLLGVLAGLILLVVVGIRTFIRGNPERQGPEEHPSG